MTWQHSYLPDGMQVAAKGKKKKNQNHDLLGEERFTTAHDSKGISVHSSGEGVMERLRVTGLCAGGPSYLSGW